jgi:hypothetical protein
MSAALIAELETYHHLRALLARAIHELQSLHRSRQPAFLSFGASEADHQKAFSRVSRFFDALRQAARGNRSPVSNERFRAETEALWFAFDPAGDERLLGWGVGFRAGCGWEVDFLGIDYQLRSHGARALASLERFASEFLDPFLARWAHKEAAYHAVALRAG